MEWRSSLPPACSWQQPQFGAQPRQEAGGVSGGGVGNGSELSIMPSFSSRWISNIYN